MKQVIEGVCPSKSNSYRIGGNRLFKKPELHHYEQSFRLQCSHYRNAMIEGKFAIHINVYFPSERADLDNSLKVVLDCLQACKAFKNDRKCTKIVAERFTDKNRPRIEFTIVPV